MKVKLAAIMAVIVVFAPGFWSADADVLTYKSAVVWRQDELGDYVLPQLQQGVYEVKETFLTEGEIKSIVVSWESKGSVLLEVSVNAGIDYIPVVNGVPLYFGEQRTEDPLTSFGNIQDKSLRAGRIQKTGKRIKWKAVVGESSQLKEVRIVYSDTSGVAGSFGNPELSGFKYRKQIHLDAGNKDTSLFNQPVKINADMLGLSSGGDFGAVRFTAADGGTILPYYIGKAQDAESGYAGEIFVKVSQIPVGGADIYVYHGSKIAAGADSGEVWDIENMAVLFPIEITVLEEEIVDLNKFSGVTVKENGNLGLVDGAVTGSFTSTSINADFDVRIISAVYTVLHPDAGMIRLDISADGGNTYMDNCVSSKYYYASTGDFSAGNELVYRFTFSAGRAPGDLIEINSIKIEYASGEMSLISPNGGEIFAAGREENILWSAREYGVYNIKLEYSLDNSRTYNLISASIANTGSFIWLVPREFSDEALVRISDPFDFTAFDVSDKPFSICSKEEAEKRTEKLEGEVVKDEAEEEIDLSAVIDDTVMRSDREEYEILVTAADNYSEDDTLVNLDKGEVIAVQPKGYEWGVSERRKFLIVCAYLTEEEADDLRPKTINTGEIDGFERAVLKKSTIDLKRIGFSGKRFSRVKGSLEKNVLSKDVFKEERIKQ